jgi:hypothetical protein
MASSRKRNKYIVEVVLLDSDGRHSGTTVVIKIPKTLQVLSEMESRKKEHGQFSILVIESTDTRVIWDRTDEKQVSSASKMFSNCVSVGLVPRKMDKRGNLSTDVMKKFDNSVEEIVFLPMKV